MKTIITIAFLLCSIGVSAQNKLPILTNIAFTLQSDNPTISWENGTIKKGITPVDTTYEMYGDKPLRRIAYRYETREGKPMEVIKKDVYNGKDWDFNSIAIQPYKNPWGVGTISLKDIQDYPNDSPIFFNGNNAIQQTHQKQKKTNK